MRLQGSTILIGSAGVLTGLAVIALAGRNKARALYTADEVFPPWRPPPIDPPEPDSIPAHSVTVVPSPVPPAASTAAPSALPPPPPLAARVTRPSPAPAKAPPPPSGIADDETERMVRELTRPDSSAASRSPRQAATDLYNYVTQALRQGLTAPLGTTAKPDDYLAAAQRDMRLIASDGVYGPKTAARGKELLGREFPERSPTKRRVTIPATVINHLPASTASVLALPPPAPPPIDAVVSETSPREAAAALFELVTHPPVDWGSKASPSSLIRGAQRDMGGLTADGIYGAKTQARGAILLGRAFPARK